MNRVGRSLIKNKIIIYTEGTVKRVDLSFIQAAGAMGNTKKLKVGQSEFRRTSDGLLIQWGVHTSDDVESSVIFPLPFTDRPGVQIDGEGWIVRTGSTEFGLYADRDEIPWVAIGRG